jgi:hypothetical protein
MILDNFGLLSDAQALTATAVSTNTFDWKAAGLDMGAGEPMCVMVTVDKAAGGSSPTFVFSVVEDDDETLGSNTNIIDRTILEASMTAGSRHIFPIPPGSVTLQYLGMEYTLGGSNPTATVTACIMPMSMIDMPNKFANGYTIG